MKARRRSSPLNAVVGVGLAVLMIAAANGHLTRPARHGGGQPQTATVTMQTVPGSPNEKLANTMAASGYGWTAVNGQQECLDLLWDRESASTWSPTVANPKSGAYGIPQSLPPDKMAAAGPDWRTNPATQIRWGLGYIAGGNPYSGRDPCDAWAPEKSAGWY